VSVFCFILEEGPHVARPPFFFPSTSLWCAPLVSRLLLSISSRFTLVSSDISFFVLFPLSRFFFLRAAILLFSPPPLFPCVPPFSFHACISAFVDFHIHSILPHFSVYHSTQSPLLICSHRRTDHSFSIKYFIQLYSNSIHSRSVPFQLLLFIPVLISDPFHVVTRCLPNRSNPMARHLLSMWNNSRIPSRYGINSGRFFSTLSTINTALPQPERPQYIANILLCCLSNSTLKAVLTMGLSATDSRNCRSGETLAATAMSGASSLPLVFNVRPSPSTVGSATFEIYPASASLKRIAALPARTRGCWGKLSSVFCTTMCVASYWSSALS
jgi:hypothetical protein